MRSSGAGSRIADARKRLATLTLALGLAACVPQKGDKDAETRAPASRTENQRSVEVVVNDGGPFVRPRIADLSLAAARRIGMIANGVVQASSRSCRDRAAPDECRRAAPRHSPPPWGTARSARGEPQAARRSPSSYFLIPRNSTSNPTGST